MFATSVFSILFSLTASTELLSVNTTILFLILFINSQIRFFSLNRPPFIICSILLDLVLLLLLHVLGGFILSLLNIGSSDLGLHASMIVNIAKIFPIYWAFDTALNFELWPNLLIILLFGIAFLSAGSFKLKNFIQH